MRHKAEKTFWNPVKKTNYGFEGMMYAYLMVKCENTNIDVGNREFRNTHVMMKVQFGSSR